MDAPTSAVPVEPGSADSSLRPAANVSRGYKVGAYERAAQDWYVEPRWCVEQLADAIQFAGGLIWDPANGGGTIPSVFEDRGHLSIGSDVIDRGDQFAITPVDFLTCDDNEVVHENARFSIVTNPPFKLAEQFVRRALALPAFRVCILQQLSFLASAARHRLFTEFPPSDVLILSRRPSMPPGAMIAEMGAKAFKGGTTDFCWIVWTKPHDRETRTRWLSPVIAA